MKKSARAMTKKSRAIKTRLRRFIFLAAAAVPFILAGNAMAQPTVAPTDGEPVGPAAGETLASYNISQSWELGYRFASVGGDYGKYRSDVNYRNGLRLLSGSLLVHSLEGHGNWFDEIALTTAGLGNDPYQSATFRIQKNRLYRYDMLWRSNDYFNPGLVVASGEHLEDTTHRWQDHDLTLFPQSAFRIHAGYGRTTEDGPTLTTEQEFNAQGDVFPIFRNDRQQYNEYRLGFDARFKAFRLTVQRRWEYFRDDSAGAVILTEAGTPPAALASFQFVATLSGANSELDGQSDRRIFVDRHQCTRGIRWRHGRFCPGRNCGRHQSGWRHTEPADRGDGKRRQTGTDR